MSEPSEVDRQFLLYQGLVRAMAWRLHRRVPRHVDLEDLVAYGQIGLLEAIERFDEGRGLQFSTFAWHRVRGAILDGLERMVWFDRIAFEKGNYEQPPGGSGDTADDRTSSRRLGVQCGVDMNTIVDRAEPPVRRLEEREAITVLMTLVATLPPREAGLLRGVFFEGRTLSEAAKRVGISTAWASRLQNRTLADLRIALETYGFA